MELTVVGNGVGGSALTRIARSRGHRVRLLSDGSPHASLVALAVVKRSWLPKSTDWSALLSHYEGATEVSINAQTTSYRNPGHFDVDLEVFAVDPSSYLLPATEVKRVPADWVDSDTQFTVHATGAAGLAGDTTWGGTWVNANPTALMGYRFKSHARAPYRTLEAVSYAMMCRLGSSSSKHRDKAESQAHELLDLAGALGWLNEDCGTDWHLYLGQRVKRDQLAQREGRRLWSFGGFHRSGYGLAPGAALALVEELERA